MSSTPKRSELVLVLLLFAASIVALARYNYSVTYIGHLDSTFLFEALDSIQKHGVPLSWTVNSLPTTFKLWATPPDVYCALPLDAVSEPYRVFDNHAYALLYLLALPAYVMSPEAVWAAMNALAHLVGLFVPYLYLRSRGIPILISALFVACAALHPGWSYSLVGDYYVDHLYMLFMVPFLFSMRLLLTAGRPSRKAIVFGFALALCAAFCSERAAIMVIGTLCFYLLFYSRELEGKGVLGLMAATAALLAVYVGVYFVFVYKPLPGAAGYFSNRIGSLQGVLNHVLSVGGLTFAVVNLLFLGLFVLWSGYRYVLLTVGALIPNTLYNLGGSEFTAWGMHYHTAYLSVIIFTACVGYERLMRWSAANRMLAAAVPLAIVAITFAAVMNLNPLSVQNRERQFVAFHDGIFGRLWANYKHENAAYEQLTVKLFRAIAEAVPTGTSVSTVEMAMPALYRGRRLAYFPLGLSTSDYMVVVGTAVDGQLKTLGGPLTYLGVKEAAEIQQCLIERIERLGYTVAKDFPGLGYVVLKKGST